jgi:hypothetical protein
MIHFSHLAQLFKNELRRGKNVGDAEGMHPRFALKNCASLVGSVLTIADATVVRLWMNLNASFSAPCSLLSSVAS